jgi:hypothetical protein
MPLRGYVVKEIKGSKHAAQPSRLCGVAITIFWVISKHATFYEEVEIRQVSKVLDL